ncbi:MAG: response regulator [Bacteroidetes bacterium]|nr:response regulator [Fibrella sp.]
MAIQLLVIEDEHQIRENVAELLTLNGFEVETAGDGREGVLRAMLRPPDLILCDVMMPKMDGYQVLEVIRSNRSLANVPFIFLTAKTDITDMRRGMSLGADDYLAKPFTSSDMLAAIKSRLQREKIRDDTVQAQLEKYRNELSRVSGHEYNTPLTGIMGFANLLTDYYDTFDKAETLSMLEMITTCCMRLKRTLDNVRLTDNLQQLNNGRFAYSSQTTDCPLLGNALIEQIKVDLSRRHEQEIHCHTDVVNARVAISGEHLTKVLDELMDNAFKFSSPVNEITVIGRPNETTYEFAIANRGRVFRAENIAKIGPHVQFDRDVYEQQGSGLGLFIAKRLVELNNGSLSIQSQIDGQTTVTVALPLLSAGELTHAHTPGAVTID